MKYVIVFGFVIGSFLSGFGQAYNNAIGVKIGTGIGITAVQRVANKTTIEGILNAKLKQNQYTVALLGKQHFPILFKRFNLYTGGGVHKGWYTGQNNITIDEPTEKIENPFGVTLVGGAEISLGKFNISYDFRPSFNFVGGEKALETENAISVRYILMDRPTKREQRRKKKKKNKGNSKGGLFDIFKKN